MKKFLFLLITCSSAAVGAQAQIDSTGIKLFNRGLDFYNQGNLDSTLRLWTEIVNRKIDTAYTTYGSALFNIPTLYWQMGRYDKAKEWYKKVIASNLRDHDETGMLMEPHTNYKHKSAVALAGLYKKDSNYAEGLRWLYLADTVYRYWGYEGSATNVSKQQAYLLGLKTDFLLSGNRRDEAVRAIVTELICAGELSGFFGEHEDRLMTLIDKKKFKAELDKSLGELVVNTVDQHNWTANFTLQGLKYTIDISNQRPGREPPHYWTKYFTKENEQPGKPELIGHVRSTDFYKRLTD